MKSKRKGFAGLFALGFAAAVGAAEANLDWKYDASARSFPAAATAAGAAQTAEAWRSAAVSTGGLRYTSTIVFFR